MKNRLLLLLIVFILFSAFRADKPVLTIFTIGDSTMANKNLYGGNPERGWCMVLPDFSQKIYVLIIMPPMAAVPKVSYLKADGQK